VFDIFLVNLYPVYTI